MTGWPHIKNRKNLSVVRLHKFKDSRVCFSILNYFLKVIFKKNSEQLLSLPKRPKLASFLETHGLTKYPKMFYQTSFLGVGVEVTEYVANASALSALNHQTFLENSLSSLRSIEEESETYGDVVWQEMFSEKVLAIIKAQPEVYKYIESSLQELRFKNTGLHGDFNQNNVLIDNRDNFWVVDWESYSDLGSYYWDLCFYYGNLRRKTSKPGHDVLSIFDQSNNDPMRSEAVLIIYSLVKLRSDFRRHNRSKNIAIRDFLTRISALIEIKNPNFENKNSLR